MDVICQIEFPSFDMYQRLLLTGKAREVRTGELALDLGAGEGIYSLQLAEAGAEVVAVDISVDSLKIVKKIAAYYGKSILLTACDGQSLPFKSEAFNSVYCLETLEHMPDDERTIGEIYRILKGFGDFVLSVPNSQFPFLWDPAKSLPSHRKKLNLEQINLIGSHLPGIGPFLGHLRTYSENELTEKIRRARLTKRNRYACGHVLLTVFLMILKLFFALKSTQPTQGTHIELFRSARIRALSNAAYGLLRLELPFTMHLGIGVTLFITGYKTESS